MTGSMTRQLAFLKDVLKAANQNKRQQITILQITLVKI